MENTGPEPASMEMQEEVLEDSSQPLAIGTWAFWGKKGAPTTDYLIACCHANSLFGAEERIILYFHVSVLICSSAPKSELFYTFTFHVLICSSAPKSELFYTFTFHVLIRSSAPKSELFYTFTFHVLIRSSAPKSELFYTFTFSRANSLFGAEERIVHPLLTF